MRFRKVYHDDEAPPIDIFTNRLFDLFRMGTPSLINSAFLLLLAHWSDNRVLFHHVPHWLIRILRS